MDSSVSLNLDFDEAQRQLNAQEAGIQEHLANDAAELMRQLCPKKSGDLASTIRVEKDESGNYRVSIGGIAGQATGKLVDYAADVNYGDANQEAQPFIEPAMTQATPKI